MTSDINGIEKVYDIKIQFDNVKLVLENCPEKILKEISSKISKLTASKVSNTFDIGPIPGIEKVLNSINTDLIEIQSKSNS